MSSSSFSLPSKLEDLLKQHKGYLDCILGETIHLDNNQRKIVVSDSKSIMVYAGAGTGKTTIIIARIKYLVERRKVDAKTILLISYTRETVKELKEKINDRLHLPVKIQTFHQFALSLLEKKKVKIISDPYPTLCDIVVELMNDKKEKYKIVRAYSSYFKGPNLLLYLFSFSLYKTLFFEGKDVSFICPSFLSFLSQNIVKIKCQNAYLKNIKIRSKREHNQLEILNQIYEKYQQKLKIKNEIDFEDMIYMGTNRIKKEEKSLHYYAHVIVDEYQDISYNRFSLLHEYITKVGSNIMVVGDDFQSIYAFSGSDISLFTHFTTYQKESEKHFIAKTYRNSNELIKVAGSFVMKNKNQVKKVLESSKSINRPLYFCTYNHKKDKALEWCLEEIINKKKTDVTIFLLGRYKFDLTFLVNHKNFKIEENKIVYKNNPSLYIQFLTVHAAKGLEADYVILVNVEDGRYGFPSKVENGFEERVTDNYLYAEERRLFYVAMTRTRNEVFFLVPKYRESCFIKELDKEYKSYIIYKEIRS